MSDPGTVAAVRRQMGAVRRRTNLHVAQHGLATWVTVAATAATALLLAAVRGGRVVFALVALAGAIAVAVATGLLVRRSARRWLRSREAAAHIDAARGLRGRLTSVLELERHGRGAFFDLLVRQNGDALPRWRPEVVVPEVVPARAFAAAVGALCALALVAVLAPKLRPAAPRILMSDRPVDFVASDRARDTADRILVAPGVERQPPDAAGASARVSDAQDESGGLADLTESFQDWLQGAIGAEERWEPGDEQPPPPGQHAGRTTHAARDPAARAAADANAAGGDGQDSDADGPASRRIDGDAAAGEESGGGGTGAGTDTDPALYGAPHDDVPPGADVFELAIAARVRTRRGAAMAPWTAAPGAEGDRRPVLAGEQRAEQPTHRMAIPASMEPLVRRLYTHSAAEEGAR